MTSFKSGLSNAFWGFLGWGLPFFLHPKYISTTVLFIKNVTRSIPFFALTDPNNCYYFAERFTFVESFKIRSSNIRNDVIRMKCWMKQGVNQSNMKTVLDEPENIDEKFAHDQIFIYHDFSSPNMIFSYFAIFEFC